MGMSYKLIWCCLYDNLEVMDDGDGGHIKKKNNLYSIDRTNMSKRAYY